MRPLKHAEAGMREKDGEHPFGDAGQLIWLGVFLVTWVGDSFFLRKSTFLSDYVPLYIRLAFLGITLITAIYLFGSGHVVVSHDHRPNKVLTTGAFRYVRHPLYLASILTYLGLTISTLSLFSLALFREYFSSTTTSQRMKKNCSKLDLERNIENSGRKQVSGCRGL